MSVDHAAIKVSFAKSALMQFVDHALIIVSGNEICFNSVCRPCSNHSKYGGLCLNIVRTPFSNHSKHGEILLNVVCKPCSNYSEFDEICLNLVCRPCRIYSNHYETSLKMSVDHAAIIVNMANLLELCM